MTSFQKGDKVTAAPGEQYGAFRDEMLITEAWIDTNDKLEYVKVSSLSGKHIGTFYATRFQLIQPMAQATGFKKGDILDQRPGFEPIPRICPTAQVRVRATYGTDNKWLDLETLSGQSIPKGYHSNGFTLAMTQDNEIKAGDTVRCKSDSYIYINRGEELIVESYDGKYLSFKGASAKYNPENFEKVETRKLVGYKLKKDLPDIVAGALFVRNTDSDKAKPNFKWCHDDKTKSYLTYYGDEDITKTDWFEPVYEKPSQEITLKSGKLIRVNFEKKQVELLGVQSGDALSFTQIRDTVSRMQAGLADASHYHVAITEIKVGCVVITLDEAVNLSILIS